MKLAKHRSKRKKQRKTRIRKNNKYRHLTRKYNKRRRARHKQQKTHNNRMDPAQSAGARPTSRPRGRGQPDTNHDREDEVISIRANRGRPRSLRRPSATEGRDEAIAIRVVRPAWSGMIHYINIVLEM